jgi:hypothetical protein
MVVTLLGFLFSAYGGDMFGMMAVSASLGVVGAVAFYKAFALWDDGRTAGTYLRLVFFLPSLSLWSSIVGKDSWVNLALGLTAYGVSAWLKTYRHSHLAIWLVAVALLAAVRPHIGCLVVLCVLATLGVTAVRVPVGRWLFGFWVCLAALWIILPLAREYTAMTDYSADAFFSAQRHLADMSIGGSAIELPRSGTLAETVTIPVRGAINVIMRPFLWEAHNFDAFLAACENIFVLIVVLRALRSWKDPAAVFMRCRYFAFCAMVALLLLCAVSLLPNLGTISRQRAQLLPFLFGACLGLSPKSTGRVKTGPEVRAFV